MRKITVIAGLGLAAALALTGCTAGTNTGTDTSAPSASSEAHAVVDTVNSDGAGLRAALQAVLYDHVYLAGSAINQALADGGDLTTVKTAAAVQALDDNSVAVAALIGSAYPDAEQPFLDSWRSHIPFFVDYTIGKATGDQAKVEKAVADLGAYAVSFGQLINSVVSDLPAEAVQMQIEMHGASLIAAIDANIAGDPNYASLLQEAAAHISETALALAGGIAANKGIE